MSYLCVFHQSNTLQPVKLLNHHADIARELGEISVHFERLEAQHPITVQSSAEEVLAVYREDIERLQQQGGYASVDVVGLDEHHLDKAAQRAKLLEERTLDKSSSRFFVAGRGLLSLHVGEQVYAVLCEKGDYISLPANIKHWFDMGEHPRFAVIRLFGSSAGWAPQFTGEDISSRYPQFDD